MLVEKVVIYLNSWGLKILTIPSIFGTRNDGLDLFSKHLQTEFWCDMCFMLIYSSSKEEIKLYLMIIGSVITSAKAAFTRSTDRL